MRFSFLQCLGTLASAKRALACAATGCQTQGVPEDARGELLDGRFDYRTQKDGRVVVTWYGRAVTTLAGKDAQKFLSRIAGLEEHAAQLVMARVTGNFRRGNEKGR